MKENNVQLRWRNKYLFIPVVLMVIFFTNCNDDATKAVFDPALPVVLESFSPDSGGVGTQMIIKGKNFGTDPKLVQVQVGKRGYKASVVGVDGEHIYAVVASQSDTGKVVVTVGTAASVTSENDFNYQFRENVSTYSGTGEAKTIDGDVDPQSGEPASFNFPIWLDKDKDGTMYILEENRGLRIISKDFVTSGFQKKDNGRQDRLRTICLSISQDTIFTGHDNGGTDKAAFFISTRAKGFLDMTEAVTGTNQNNTVQVNPVDGEVFFNCFGRCEIFRYDKTTGKAVIMGKLGNDNNELHLCWSLDGRTLFVIARDRNYIAVADYDIATKTLSNLRPVMGRMNADGNAAEQGFRDGKGFDAWFRNPSQMVAGPNGDYFLADRRNHCIRRITADFQVTTYAGVPENEGMEDGMPLKSRFREPEGLAIDKDGTLYVADKGNHRIRKIVIE